MVSGTMYHASYIKIPDSEPPQSKWVVETRAVDDLSKSKSLVLLYRIAQYVNTDMLEFQSRFEAVLQTVPLGKVEREGRIGPCKGHPKLGGYDCIIVSINDKRFSGNADMRKWTGDALNALVQEKLIDLGDKTAGMSRYMDLHSSTDSQ